MIISGGERRVSPAFPVGEFARGLGILFAVATMPALVALGGIKHIESQQKSAGKIDQAQVHKAEPK